MAIIQATLSIKNGVSQSLLTVLLMALLDAFLNFLFKIFFQPNLRLALFFCLLTAFRLSLFSIPLPLMAASKSVLLTCSSRTTIKSTIQRNCFSVRKRHELNMFTDKDLDIQALLGEERNWETMIYQTWFINRSICPMFKVVWSRNKHRSFLPFQRHLGQVHIKSQKNSFETNPQYCDCNRLKTRGCESSSSFD